MTAGEERRGGSGCEGDGGEGEYPTILARVSTGVSGGGGGGGGGVGVTNKRLRKGKVKKERKLDCHNRAFTGHGQGGGEREQGVNYSMGGEQEGWSVLSCDLKSVNPHKVVIL